MTLEMTFFRAELVQLIVSRSDSELEVQRYSMKKNTLTVDPIMLQDELWMRQRENPSPNCRNRFFENRTAETEFLVFEFWGRLGSVHFLENRYPIFFIGFRTPLICNTKYCQYSMRPVQCRHYVYCSLCEPCRAVSGRPLHLAGTN